MPRHFFIAGAQRCATTYLCSMLAQHPDVDFAQPLRPEPKYFLRPEAELRREAYEAEFFAGASGAWRGEKSTSYIEHPAAAARIARMFPDALVFFMLRDPVERALSNYSFSVHNGLETLPLDEALATEHERLQQGPGNVSVSPFAYAARGHYVRYLDAWCRHFPREQVHLLVTERTVGCEGAIRDVFRRLDLRADVALASVMDRVNTAPGLPGAIDADLRRQLRARFAASNLDLAARYGVDVTPWQ